MGHRCGSPRGYARFVVVAGQPGAAEAIGQAEEQARQDCRPAITRTGSPACSPTAISSRSYQAASTPSMM